MGQSGETHEGQVCTKKKKKKGVGAEIRTSDIFNAIVTVVSTNAPIIKLDPNRTRCSSSTQGMRLTDNPPAFRCASF